MKVQSCSSNIGDIMISLAKGDEDLSVLMLESKPTSNNMSACLVLFVSKELTGRFHWGHFKTVGPGEVVL